MQIVSANLHMFVQKLKRGYIDILYVYCNLFDIILIFPEVSRPVAS
jgi:hypothetical protein